MTSAVCPECGDYLTLDPCFGPICEFCGWTADRSKQVRCNERAGKCFGCPSPQGIPATARAGCFGPGEHCHGCEVNDRCEYY